MGEILKTIHVIMCKNKNGFCWNLSTTKYRWGVLVVKTMDCEIVVSEFILQSRYYVHFWANTLRKGMNPLILLAMD